MSTIPDDIKDKIVEMYRDGIKGETIAREVGVPRPTVYLILQQRGIRPSRQKVMQSRQLSPEQLIEQIAERDRKIGRMEHEIEQLRAQIALLMERS